MFIKEEPGTAKPTLQKRPPSLGTETQRLRRHLLCPVWKLVWRCLLKHRGARPPRDPLPRLHLSTCCTADRGAPTMPWRRFLIAGKQRGQETSAAAGGQGQLGTVAHQAQHGTDRGQVSVPTKRPQEQNVRWE